VYWQVRDGDRVKVEDRLNKFFIAALRRVDQERKWEREREREAAVRREAERKRLEEEERQRQAEEVRKREQARVQALVNEVARWRQSREIREYLAEVRRVIAGRGQVIEAGSKLDEWLKWAERTAVAMDPLRPPEPAQS
jgi:dTMP kinase